MVTSAAHLNAKPFVRWSVLFASAALAAYLLPSLGAVLIYDRSAILGGELWRLATGHWVHFSASHLAYDVAVLGITGWIIESRGYRYFPTLCLLSALLIGLVMLIALADMALYGGLSGVAMASTVYMALHGLREPGPWRGACLAILLLSVGKIAIEAVSGQFMLVDSASNSFVPVPLSHVTGAVSGLAIYFWSRKNRSVGNSFALLLRKEKANLTLFARDRAKRFA